MVALLSLVALGLAWKAFRRSAQMERLAARVAELESQLNLLRIVANAPAAENATPLHEATVEESILEPMPPPMAPSEPEAPLSPWEADEPAITPAELPPIEPVLPPPPPPPVLQIDWEQWIGVRGAAVVGGVVLALAGVFLFRYSIEHGLIPPWLRVVIGLTGGAACIAISEWWMRQRYELTANAVAGAGIVILYAALWGAYVLYQLVGVEPTFAAMILVTATCCALSWRHSSLVIALLGLAGGFMTPLLLSTGTDRPIGLFAYVLLLDIGMLYVADRRAWPILAVLSLFGTFLYQAGWIVLRMGPDRVWLGIAILTLFAGLFAVSGHRVADRRDPQWLITQVGGILLPFGFAAYFAVSADLTPHLYPIAAMMLMLGGGAAWIARVQNVPRLGLAAAAAIVAVFGVWIVAHSSSTALAWEAAGSSFLLAACFHLFVEWNREDPGWDGPAPAALAASFGLFFFLLVGALTGMLAEPWPWIAGWMGLAALQIRHAMFPQRRRLNMVTAIILGLAFSALTSAQQIRLYTETVIFFPNLRLYLGTLVGLAVIFQVLALVPADRELRLWRERAAATLALLLLLSFVPHGMLRSAPISVVLGGTTLLGALAAMAATRMPSGEWLLAAIAATAVGQTAWYFAPGNVSVETARLSFLIQFATSQLFAAWPFVFTSQLRRERWAWNAAALAGALWFPALRGLFEQTFGSAYIGVLPLMLSVTALAAAYQVRQIWPEDDEWRRTRLAWFLTFAMGFVSIAIPLQLDKSWITVGWALQAVGVILLWQRFDNPGLKYFAAGLFAAVTVRLVANPAVLDYYPRAEWRVINWLLYTYLIPAATLLWASFVLSRHELRRVRPWEKDLYSSGQPVGALFTGFAAMTVVFVWINLTIADWFATDTLQVTVTELLSTARADGTAARDLAMSIAWAVYALVLLAVGVRFANRGVRWVSLALMMVTIVKVFLHDLGELRDLYRVASLFGLALSLIAVSLAYQRFVSKRPVEEAS